MSIQSIPSLSTTRSLTLTVTQFASFATPAVTVPFPSAYGQTQIPFVFAATPTAPSGPLRTVGAAAAIPRPAATGAVVPSNNGTGAGANGGMLPPRARGGLPSWAVPTIAAVGGLAVVFFLVGMYCCCKGRKSKKERARVASERQRSGKSFKQEQRYGGGSEKYTREKQGGAGWGAENTRGRQNIVRSGVTPSTSNESMRSDGRYPRMSSESEQPSQSYQQNRPPHQNFQSTSNLDSAPLAPPLAPWERNSTRDGNRTDSTSSFDSIAPLTKGRSGRNRDERTRTRAESAVRVRGEDGRGGNGYGANIDGDQRQRGPQSQNRSSSQPRSSNNDIERPRSAQSKPIRAQEWNGVVADDLRRARMPPMERQRSAPAVPTQRPMSDYSGRRSSQGGYREDQRLMNDRMDGSDSPPRRTTRPASSYTSPPSYADESELAYNTQFNSQHYNQDSSSDEFIRPQRYRPQRSRTESPQRPDKSLHRPPPTMAAAPKSRERVGSSGSGGGVQGPRAMRGETAAEVDGYSVA